MGDIILDAPIEISQPAYKVTNYEWSITPEGIIAQLNYYDASGTIIVRQETFYISGADYDPLKNATISAGVVGQKYIDVIEKAIRNKVLQLKGWTGTVP